MRLTGSFIIIINSENPFGPNAIYCISRSNISESGKIHELVKSNDTNDDQILDLIWDPFRYPLLNVKVKLDTFENIDVLKFYIRVVSSFPFI